MNAIEIKGLTKNFGDKQALKGLDMAVPMGAIYGFIGENGSGKSTTEKLICGLLVPSGGTIKLFGREYTDADVRAKVGVLIEAPGCFPNYSVWNNMMLQAANLNIPNAVEEVKKTLKMVRMEGAASNKYKNCSLGMPAGMLYLRAGWTAWKKSGRGKKSSMTFSAASLQGLAKRKGCRWISTRSCSTDLWITQRSIRTRGWFSLSAMVWESGRRFERKQRAGSGDFRISCLLFWRMEIWINTLLHPWR